MMSPAAVFEVLRRILFSVDVKVWSTSTFAHQDGVAGAVGNKRNRIGSSRWERQDRYCTSPFYLRPERAKEIVLCRSRCVTEKRNRSWVDGTAGCVIRCCKVLEREICSERIRATDFAISSSWRRSHPCARSCPGNGRRASPSSWCSSSRSSRTRSSARGEELVRSY